MEEIRLAKLMSLKGICSRREAEGFIERSQVLVDGKVISKQGFKVSINSKIELLDEAKLIKNQKVTIILNKPLGILSCQTQKDLIPAIDLITANNKISSQKNLRFSIDHINKLSVAGRLDIDSTGLLVFTQDGTIAKKLIGENSNIEKEYLVRVVGTLTNEKIQTLTFGLSLDGKKLKEARITMRKKNQLIVVLKEGKNRQIRRMCGMVGLRVISLKRIRIGNVFLNDMPNGKWRYLLENERF